MNPRALLTQLRRVGSVTVCLAISFAMASVATAQDSQQDNDSLFFNRDQVLQIENFLTQFGYDLAHVDGVVDPETVRATDNLAMRLRDKFDRKPSGRELVLNCTVEGAAEPYTDIQIMIDHYKQILIYNFQLTDNDYSPIMIAKSNGERTYLNLSMQIVTNNEDMILATGIGDGIIIIKRNGKFVHTFVTSIPGKNGLVYAFANILRGKCVGSPFE